MVFRIPQPAPVAPPFLAKRRKGQRRRWVNHEWLKWRRLRARVSLARFAEFWGFGVKRLQNVEAGRVRVEDEELRAYRQLVLRRRKTAVRPEPAPEEPSVPVRVSRQDGQPWTFGAKRFMRIGPYGSYRVPRPSAPPERDPEE